MSQVLGIAKNSVGYSVRVGGGSTSRVIPDYILGRKLIEIKTSGGAINTFQAQKLGALAAEGEVGGEIVYLFFKKPPDDRVASLLRNIEFGAGGSEVPVYINYLFP